MVAAYLLGSPRLSSSSRPFVIVVGAGAFGGWSALHLIERGVNVLLLDSWGPGNSRASSGGETRTIRATYGPAHTLYVNMVARALQLWQEYEQRWDVKLFFRSGALRMAGADDSYESSALPVLKQAGIAFEKLSPEECSKRWPQINFGGVPWSIYEPRSGFLAARRACETVLTAFLKQGGHAYQEISLRTTQPDSLCIPIRPGEAPFRLRSCAGSSLKLMPRLKIVAYRRYKVMNYRIRSTGFMKGGSNLPSSRWNPRFQVSNSGNIHGLA